MVITDKQAIFKILSNKEKFAIYVGAGASVDSGVITAKTICEDIRDLLISHGVTTIDDYEKYLEWNDHSSRYSTCIEKAYPSEASRVDYFTELLAGIKPSFFHYGTSLLISHKILKNIAITTNFDKLLELAFYHIGNIECQAIRMPEESRFISNSDKDKCYLLKIHGDYDTHNISNTSSETTIMPEDIYKQVENALKNAGLVVLGTAGYEKSIHTMFDKLAVEDNIVKNKILEYGLLWGIYMGADKPHNLTEEESNRLLLEKLNTDTVNKAIVSKIKETYRRHSGFNFFPIWGAGEFIFDLIQKVGGKNNALVGTANLYLDHEMRLRYVLSTEGLVSDAIIKHIESLRFQKKRYESGRKVAAKVPEIAFTIINTKANYEIQISYGDITSRRFLNDPENTKLNNIVISPDDTFLSAGGGVAYGLLEKGSKTKILHELYKFSPVEQNDVVVTSGFDLPVKYIFHVAALEIDKNADYNISTNTLDHAMQNVMKKFQGLDGHVLYIPLIGSGLGKLSPVESFNSIFNALKTCTRSTEKRVFHIVISEEKRLGREYLKDFFETLSKPEYSYQEIA
ncbi:MAG: macro domain-containing protein [Phycisphaerae bacterium]|nr:macro domain-containing protein [Saprospiraceae bacterium]